jgi:cytochrome c-type biogenesis protein
MIELSFAFAVSAFIAGFIMFLAPCTLPLVPAYLGFISGVDHKALENPETAKKARRTIFLNGLAFIVGFSIVFIIFGTLAGLLGSSLAAYRIWLTRIGGVLVILFGLFMLGVFKLPFFRGNSLPVPKWLTLGRPSSSLLIGGAFAFGWTPCIGPILGSILLLAGTSGTALQGAVLLAIFSLGMAIPFILIAAVFSKATVFINKISKYLKIASIVGGVFLILLGLLLITDNFGLLIQYGYEWFDFINYDRLLDYL